MQENPEKTTSGGPALSANPPEGYTFYYIYILHRHIISFWIYRSWRWYRLIRAYSVHGTHLGCGTFGVQVLILLHRRKQP